MIISNNEEEESIDLFREISFNVYPNPASEIINVDYPEVVDGTFEIQIIDANGKLVMNRVFKDTNGEQLDVSNLKKGLYMVKVLINDELIGTEQFSKY